MKNITVIILNLILFFPNFSFAQNTIPTQAKPLVDVLVSVKENDLQRFKNAFSQKINYKEKDWNTNLAEGRKNLLAKFGDYNLKDFEFIFSGDNQEGKVVLYYQNQPHFSMAVIKEPKGWKLNDH